MTDGEWEYTWENGRQLAAMESDTAEWTFKYNADGLRTERSNGTVTYDYIYSGSQLIQMTVGTDTLYFTYDASGTPMAVDFNGTKYFYATNLQGDIIAILDNAGNAVVEYTYDAWGNHLSTTGTMANTLGAVNPLRYRGYVYDRETKFFYLQSRYYDPELGRFINADAYASTGQGILGNNMFAYCSNEPVFNVDQSGCFSSPCTITLDEGDTSPALYIRAWIIASQYTTIEEKNVNRDGDVFITYNIDVDTKLFSDWKSDWYTMKEATEIYADFVYSMVLDEVEAKDSGAFWIMDKNHIYSEMMAHIDCWFSFGIDMTEEANLNVNEDRWYVKFIMRLYGYTGSEEVIYK